MAYTVREMCPRCGRTYEYPGGAGNPDCPLCWLEPDLTEAEAAAENDKDDS